MADPYTTSLSQAEERQFQRWKARYAPRDSGEDYDLRGAFKAGFKPDPERGHFPDTFKKPNHPTFSNQSIYATPNAPRWEGYRLIDPSGRLIADETPIQELGRVDWSALRPNLRQLMLPGMQSGPSLRQLMRLPGMR